MQYAHHIELHTQSSSIITPHPYSHLSPLTPQPTRNASNEATKQQVIRGHESISPPSRKQMNRARRKVYSDKTLLISSCVYVGRILINQTRYLLRPQPSIVPAAP